MAADLHSIDENYRRILYESGEAMAKYRKPGEKLNIMAVTKTVDPEAVNHAVGLGISLLGENRVQEYLSKKERYDKSAQVHFIGHLQTNKVKYIIDSTAMIQSVDSIKLAAEIDRHAAKIGKIQDILIEVNIGGEESKSGVTADEAEDLVRQAAEMKNIKVRGLMTIPPSENSEKFLCDMQKLYIDISDKNIDNINMDFLSMGMSGDYVRAIKYGSNIIRIGRGLFGPRSYK
ncbi:MAG: YggS family pyridoxal phosphate-dependent enzyme [Porcipelethomonas sp.]